MKNKRGYTLLLPILLVFTFLFYSNAIDAAEPDVKMGYVDLQRALNECLAGKQAMMDLKVDAKRQEEELNLKQEELKKLKEEIDKKRSVWNEDVRDKKEREFQAKAEGFQGFFYKSNEELQQRKKEREAEIIQGLMSVMKEIAKEKGYTYVFEMSAGGLLVAPEEVDFTEEVIETYDNKFKVEKK
ncbi:MAG: OmpH family outer membrane protein [Thermodesulfobacteriota bacterium]